MSKIACTIIEIVQSEAVFTEDMQDVQSYKWGSGKDNVMQLIEVCIMCIVENMLCFSLLHYRSRECYLR